MYNIAAAMHNRAAPINFWTQSHPMLMLAPMEDVTDTAFRETILENSQTGKIDILFTEFLSTDGMCHPIGRTKVEHRLKVSASERRMLQEKSVKLVAQIWGNTPERFAKTIQIIQNEYHFDGIDINMGCPVKNVFSHGSCSALIGNEPLAGEIIAAAREATDLPLSVKTRLGIKDIETERWMSFLLSKPLDAIILHGRIQKQMSDGQANWAEIGKAVTLRNQLAPSIKIIGNGDVTSLAQAYEKVALHGVDGVMIGRGIFKDPWLFGDDRNIDITKKLNTLQDHLSRYEQAWGTTKNYAILKRFFKIYVSGFDGAAELRHELMQTNSYNQARGIIKEWAITKVE
jgi:tRNA-dihydrouridine synthase